MTVAVVSYIEMRLGRAHVTFRQVSVMKRKCLIEIDWLREVYGKASTDFCSAS